MIISGITCLYAPLEGQTGRWQGKRAGTRWRIPDICSAHVETDAFFILYGVDWYNPSQCITFCLSPMPMSYQSQVDAAPLFPEALVKLEVFLVKNGLIDATTGQRLVRFCWCSDGPFDIRDFVVKQCFLSQVGVYPFICRPHPVNTRCQMKMPAWIQSDVLDVRSLVVQSISTSRVCHSWY